MAKKITTYSEYCAAVCEKIAHYRQLTGLSQMRFCEQHDFPLRTLQRIEGGDSEYGILLRTTFQLAQIFNLPIHELLNIEGWYEPTAIRERKKALRQSN